MIKVLREYEDGDYNVIEFTEDGETVYGESRILKSSGSFVENEVLPTIEEKILAESQYQTMLLELSSLGGI